MNVTADTLPTREPIRTREVRWSTIALYIGVSTALTLLLLLVRRMGPLGQLLSGPAWRENLFFFATLLIIAVGGVMFGAGRLRPVDVGLRRSKLAQGMIVTAGLWLLIQLIAAVPSAITTRTIFISRAWVTNGVGPTFIWAAVMFLGAALYEEVAYRGFLFPQLYLRFRGSHRRRFWTAVIVSQVLFAIGHIPAHIVLRHLSGVVLWRTVVLQGLAGVMFLLLYLRTRNLWISIGIHGLADAPTPLIRGTESWEPFLILLLLVWPWIARKPEQRGLARIEPIGHLRTAPVAFDFAGAAFGDHRRRTTKRRIDPRQQRVVELEQPRLLNVDILEERGQGAGKAADVLRIRKRRRRERALHEIVLHLLERALHGVHVRHREREIRLDVAQRLCGQREVPRRVFELGGSDTRASAWSERTTRACADHLIRRTCPRSRRARCDRRARCATSGSVVRHLAAKISQRRDRKIAVMSRLSPLLGAGTQEHADPDHRRLEEQRADRSTVLRTLLDV